MILVKGGAPVPVPLYTAEEYRARYHEMHRRAQAAEARASKAERLAATQERLGEDSARAATYWFEKMQAVRGQLFKVQRQRDALRHAQPNALARFIAIGKAFP